MDNPSYDYNTSFEKIKRLVDFDNKKNLKILDVACGDGRISQALIKMGHQVHGVDGDPRAVEIANQIGLNCKESNIEEVIPFEDDFFDLVLALDILEHLNNPKDFLVRVKSKLKVDGQIIISIPNHFDLRNRLRILLGKGIIHWAHRNFSDAKSWMYPHIRFYRRKELIELLSSVGLHVSRVQYNFMAGGLIPTRLTPSFLRKSLLKLWPNLLSGKFVFNVSQNKNSKTEKIYLSKTPFNF